MQHQRLELEDNAAGGGGLGADRGQGGEHGGGAERGVGHLQPLAPSLPDIRV